MDLKINFNFNWGIILTLIFFILKIMKLINWRWIWVFSPLWIDFIILTIIWIVLKKKNLI